MSDGRPGAMTPIAAMVESPSPHTPYRDMEGYGSPLSSASSESAVSSSSSSVAHRIDALHMYTDDVRRPQYSARSPIRTSQPAVGSSGSGKRRVDHGEEEHKSKGRKQKPHRFHAKSSTRSLSQRGGHRSGSTGLGDETGHCHRWLSPVWCHRLYLWAT